MGLLLLAVLSVESWAQGLLVEQARWGFNGKVQNSTFAFLSVEVINASNEAFEGSVTLQQESFGPSGPRLRQNVYVAPGGRRLVQFYPQIQEVREWSLRWGKKGYHRLPDYKIGHPAAVRLSDSGGLGPAGFPYQHFPIAPVVGDLARTISIDFSPRWDPARRTAFENWVRLGGTVRLFRKGGVYPDLGPAFAQEPGVERKRLDRGLIVFEEGETVTGHLSDGGEGNKKSRQIYGHFSTEQYSRAMDRATRPDIPWDILGLIAIVYVLIIGPGHYFWGRNLRRYGFGLAAFFGGVLLFSSLFAYVGRRGYGETTTITSLAHARVVSGLAEVQSWNHAFVTKGDEYEFKHSAPFNLYSPADHYGQGSRASIRNGRDGRLKAEIPVFSAQLFVHLGLFPFDGLVTVENLDGANTRFALPSSFGKIDAVWLRQDKKLYNMGRDGDQYEVARTLSVVDPAEMKTQANSFLNGYGYGYVPRGSSREVRLESFFQQMQKALLVQANPDWGQGMVRRQDGAQPVATIFVYAETPESFLVSKDAFPQQNSRVLFEIPIYEDQAP